MKLLFLRLEGPLQSWGEKAKWDHRDCAVMPTKSGVVGLIACALGLERGAPAIAELSCSLRMAVRADRSGRFLTDFHTIHADSAKGERICNAEGKPRGDTIVTSRVYLQDASFLVAIAAQESVLERLDAALCSPRWVPYLGRKSCVPSLPVYRGISSEYTDLEDAMRRFPMAGRADETIQYEFDAADGTGYLRSDEIEDIGLRRFMMRLVTNRSVRWED